jgi:hypothetical protein
VLLLNGISIFQSSCKEDTIIKAKAAPNSGGIEVIAIPDTLTLITKSTYIDTYNTSKNPLTIAALGSVNSSYFGTTKAGMIFQVEPPAAGFRFSTAGHVLDSAFVILPYTGFKWGDTVNAASDYQSLSVYRINEDLHIDSNYYSNHQPVLSDKISNTFQYDFKKLSKMDSVSIWGKNYPPHLRIPLNAAFIQLIGDKAGVNSSPEMATTVDFLNFFKGIYIQPEGAGGHLLPYFYLTGAADYSRAAIVFYYHTGNDTLTAFFNFVAADCARYNYIQRDQNSPAFNYYNSQKTFTNSSDSLLFVQNEPGFSIDVRMPYIKNLPLGIINKAQFTLTQLKISAASNDSMYFPPARIDPYHINDDGTVSYTADWNLSDLTAAVNFTNGNPSTINLGGGISVTTYTINVPREVQKAIVEKWNELHLRLRGAPGYPAGYQYLCGGRTSVISKLKFEIFYSKP